MTRQKRQKAPPERFGRASGLHPLPAGPLPPEGVAEGGGRGVRLAHGLGRAFEAMPDRAEGARAVLRLVEILGESWMDFANRQQSRAPSGFSRSGRVELPWGLGVVTVGVGWSYRGGHTYSHQITLPQCSPVSGSMATLSKRPPE